MYFQDAGRDSPPPIQVTRKGLLIQKALRAYPVLSGKGAFDGRAISNFLTRFSSREIRPGKFRRPSLLTSIFRSGPSCVCRRSARDCREPAREPGRLGSRARVKCHQKQFVAVPPAHCGELGPERRFRESMPIRNNAWLSLAHRIFLLAVGLLNLFASAVFYPRDHVLALIFAGGAMVFFGLAVKKWKQASYPRARHDHPDRSLAGKNGRCDRRG